MSTSSPECDDKKYLYPGLKLISMEEGGGCDENTEREIVSPEIPVLCPTPIKGNIISQVMVVVGVQ